MTIRFGVVYRKFVGAGRRRTFFSVRAVYRKSVKVEWKTFDSVEVYRNFVLIVIPKHLPEATRGKNVVIILQG